MANHDYIISEVKFFQEKDKEKTKEFLSGIEIDLDKQCNSIIPTVSQIKENINEFGLKSKQIEDIIEITNLNDEALFYLIFDKDITEDNQVFIFEIGRGSNYEILIDFIKFLGNSFGKFLLYSDSGLMTLISNEKSTELILKEFRNYR